MPPILSDPPPALFLLLIVAVLISAAILYRRQNRKSLVVFAVIAILLVGLWIVSALYESPREEAVRRIQLMVQAVNERSAERFVAQTTDPVDYRTSGGSRMLTKAEVRNSRFWGLLAEHNVEAGAWDFDRNEVREVAPDAIEIGFLAQGTVQGKPTPFYFRTVFRKQSNSEWLLASVSCFNPVNRNQPESIPAFP